jgi:hypothetical protein
MLKKITVLAMAVGVVAAFALPASASAAWKQNHQQPIPDNKTLGLTGTVAFHGKVGAVQCQITSTTTLFANQTTGQADTFQIHPAGPEAETKNCKGLGGLAFCQIHNITPQVPNWQVHTEAWQTTQLVNHANGTQTTVAGVQDATAATVTLGGQVITSQATGGFCPLQHISLTGATVGFTCTPTNCTNVTALDLNGVLLAHFTTPGGVQHTEDVQVTGELQIEAPNSGVYSI